MTTDTNKLINIDGKMFRRPEAWFGLFQRSTSFDGSPVDAPLHLGTCRGAATLAPDKNRLADVFPTFGGEKLPFTIEARPAELTLITERGNVRFSFADGAKLLAEGDPGMGLRFVKSMGQHESVHRRKNGAWEVFFRLTCTFIFKGLNGSAFEFTNPDTGKAPWDWAGLSSGNVLGETKPAPDGTFTLVMEESVFNGVVRDEYPTYADAKASMQSAWDAFIGAMPAFTAPYEDARIDAEHTLWSFMLAPQGRIPSPQIQFFAGIIASQWQMCQNAVALMEHSDLALGLLQGPLDFIGREGQLPDMYDEVTFESQCTKPPMHGWALKLIMAKKDIIKECGREKVEKLYTGLCKWADWWLTLRDEDGDGLPVVYHSDETGLDDCSLFTAYNTLVTPDIAAYLVLLLEANGDLAKSLGKPDGEYTAWYDKSKRTLDTLLNKLWDGKHFVGINPETGEKLVSQSILHYVPAVLGNRLPPEIIDKLADELSDQTTFNSPWGLASEAMTSPLYAPIKFGLGCILPPMMLYICTGLWETHRRAAAKEFMEKYCSALAKSNIPFFIDAKNGSGIYYGSSWACCAYVTLAKMLSE